MAPGKSAPVNGNQLRNTSMFSSGIGSQHPFGTYNSPQVVNQPPPLPPRQQSQGYSGYNDYRSQYPSYSSYGYGNNYYRPYGNYGSYGGYSPYSSMSGYNNYGYYGGPSGDVENRFVQYAEESTRSTFQLIETVLQTFSSVTMMLDSTYFALTNSFRAILSVAESMSRLRNTFGQLLSTFTLIKFLRWLYYRIKYILGLRGQNDYNEELWQGSVEEVTNGDKVKTPSTSSSWSGLILLGGLAIIPYLIHKLLSNARQFQPKEIEPKDWVTLDEPVYGATAQYDFVSRSNDELNLKAGQKVWIAPQSLQPRNMPGWWKATDTVKVGLIPSNYVNIVGQMKKNVEPRVLQNATPKPFTASTTRQLDQIFDASSSEASRNNTSLNTEASQSTSISMEASKKNEITNTETCASSNSAVVNERETKTTEEVGESSSGYSS